jgi:hypothetical protein
LVIRARLTFFIGSKNKAKLNYLSINENNRLKKDRNPEFRNKFSAGSRANRQEYKKFVHFKK